MYMDKSIKEVEKELGTEIQSGLSEAEAEKRRQKYGENRLTGKKEKGLLGMFWNQLNDPLIYILLAAIAISLFLGEAGEAGIIAVVICLNAVVGVIQEGKARKAIESLQRLTSPKALVKREGIEKEISSEMLVPGDIVFLEAGRQVPADMRLCMAVNLQIEEAALTGESVPAQKSHDKEEGQNGGILDSRNMAFMTTAVTAGRGMGIVTATGMQTEIGKIADLLENDEKEITPLQKRLADLGKVLSIAAVCICVLLFLIAVWQKRDIGEMLLTAISLAVAAVPEGLPAVVTIVLALSVSRMVKVGTIVRKLPSVETLGAVSVICSDKTGTLTQNKMTVKKCYVDGRLTEAEKMPYQDGHPLFSCCVLCNDAVIGAERIGDPTELALLDFAEIFGVKKEEEEAKNKRVEENAFDSERKRMTTVHHTKEGKIAYCKGAADEILMRCNKILIDGREEPFSEAERKKAKEAVGKMAQEALRVLAFAMKRKGKLTEEKDMIFIGLTGMMDPPREGVKEAVASFKKAHVDTVMITGDHIDTAFAIAKQLGITAERKNCITGSDIDGMTAEEFAQKADDIRVYARVSPQHKVKIVDALKKKGKIVAMTGDGINDAPSLKAADVGITMGRGGTDVARSAADIVLTDDNFATIEKAMREGRGVYENIRKTILFLLSSNFGEIITMMVAVVVGLPTPLKASHILWVNLITDSLPALSLGVDKNDGEALMKQPPRKNSESMFAHGGLSCMLCYGVVIGIISLLAFLTVPYQELLRAGLPVNFPNLKDMLQLPGVLSKAQTHAFTVLGMSQLMHAVGMRDTNRSIFNMKHLENVYMLFSFGLGIALQVLVTEIPYFVKLFGTSRLTLSEWGTLFLLSALPLAVHELLVLSEFLINGVGKSEKTQDGQQNQQYNRKQSEAV